MIQLARFLAPYKGRIALLLALLLLHVFGTLYIPTLTADIVNTGIVPGNVNRVWQAGKVMLVVAILASAASILDTYLSTHIFAAMGRDIRSALFRKSQHLTIDEFNRFGPASMITRCTNDITQIQQAYMTIVEMLLPAPIMSIVGLFLAFSKSPALAILIVLSMLAVCVLTLLVGSKAMGLLASLQTKLDVINRTLRERLMGIRVIRAFNRSEHERRRSDEAYEQYASTAIRVNRIFAGLMPLIMGIMNVCVVAIIAVGGQNAADGRMGIGDIMALIEYASLIMMYLVMGISVFLIIPRAQTCADRVNEVLNLPSERNMATPALDGAVSDSPKLEFRDVTFRYQGAEEPVLHNVSFTVRTGETTAIIGGTGSGKSTIADLIAHFHDIESGVILLDGKDTTYIPEDRLRDHIGFVPQKAFLFSGTIMDNIRHGKQDATPEEVRHAARTAQIADYIDGLEKGYDTRVCQGGDNFSGGQRQRLSIARALVRKPDIYVFDDSFSALDFKTDARLRVALNQETKNAAVILIAQRISTIMDAERIIVLDEGRVAGIDTHEQLMANCETYRQIAESQLNEKELA